MSKHVRVAIVGATGAVGTCMMQMLEKRHFPVSELRLLASDRSAGKELLFQKKKVPVKELTHDSFAGIDIALFSAGASRSREFAHSAVRAGAVVIDNTSEFRMHADVPLVVPEVNAEAIATHKGIIANPNCSTIQMVVALKPLHDFAKVKRVVVSTYQSVSGAGQSAIIELEEQTKAFAAGQKPLVKKFQYQILHNLIPQIDIPMDNFYTKEEMKMVEETKKIMGDQSIRVTATCVRVPVFRSHSESVNVETELKVTRKKALELLRHAPGVEVVDDLIASEYPMPLSATDKQVTFVGRIREDESVENGLNLWVVSDNLLKGAALNAVQIAEVLVSAR